MALMFTNIPFTFSDLDAMTDSFIFVSHRRNNMAQQQLSPGLPITIIPVQNGFIAREEGTHSHVPMEQSEVFQSMAELVTFLEERYTHRNSEIFCDSK